MILPILEKKAWRAQRRLLLDCCHSVLWLTKRLGELGSDGNLLSPQEALSCPSSHFLFPSVFLQPLPHPPRRPHISTSHRNGEACRGSYSDNRLASGRLGDLQCVADCGVCSCFQPVTLCLKGYVKGIAWHLDCHGLTVFSQLAQYS